MKPENKQFLDELRPLHDLYVKAQYIKHFDGATRQRLLDVIREEFQPGYLADLWCSSCVADMLVFAFTQYDKQPKEILKPKKERK